MCLVFSSEVYKSLVIDNLDAVDQRGFRKPAGRQIGAQGVKL